MEKTIKVIAVWFALLCCAVIFLIALVARQHRLREEATINQTYVIGKDTVNVNKFGDVILEE